MATALKVLWDILDPITLFLTIIVITTAILTYGHVRWRRIGTRLMLYSVVIAFITTGLPFGSLLLYPLEQRFAKDLGLPEMPAGIIVLGGGVDAELSHLRQNLELNSAGDRVLAMLHLSQLFPSAPVVYSGGPGDWRTQSRGDADALGNSPLVNALLEERLIVEKQSRNTHENALEAKKVVPVWAAASDAPWVLVTSAWHMPRAVGAFRAEGWNVHPYPVDYRSGRRFETGLLRWSKNLEDLKLAIKEWAGLVIYHKLGWSDSTFPSLETKGGE